MKFDSNAKNIGQQTAITLMICTTNTESLSKVDILLCRICLRLWFFSLQQENLILGVYSFSKRLSLYWNLHTKDIKPISRPKKVAVN